MAYIRSTWLFSLDTMLAMDKGKLTTVHTTVAHVGTKDLVRTKMDGSLQSANDDSLYSFSAFTVFPGVFDLFFSSWNPGSGVLCL